MPNRQSFKKSKMSSKKAAKITGSKKNLINKNTSKKNTVAGAVALENQKQSLMQGFSIDQLKLRREVAWAHLQRLRKLHGIHKDAWDFFRVIFAGIVDPQELEHMLQEATPDNLEELRKFEDVLKKEITQITWIIAAVEKIDEQLGNLRPKSDDEDDNDGSGGGFFEYWRC